MNSATQASPSKEVVNENVSPSNTPSPGSKNRGHASVHDDDEDQTSVGKKRRPNFVHKERTICLQCIAEMLPQETNSERLWKKTAMMAFEAYRPVAGKAKVLRDSKELKTMLKNVKNKYWKWVLYPETRPTGWVFTNIFIARHLTKQLQETY